MTMHVTTRTITWHGKPCLEFSNGHGKPFSLGKWKLRTILASLDQIEAWLVEQGEAIIETPQAKLGDVSVDLARLDALEKRLTSLERTTGIIVEEITRSATQPPVDSADGVRSIQID